MKSSKISKLIDDEAEEEEEEEEQEEGEREREAEAEAEEDKKSVQNGNELDQAEEDNAFELFTGNHLQVEEEEEEGKRLYTNSQPGVFQLITICFSCCCSVSLSFAY